MKEHERINSRKIKVYRILLLQFIAPFLLAFTQCLFIMSTHLYVVETYLFQCHTQHEISDISAVVWTISYVFHILYDISTQFGINASIPHTKSRLR